METRIKEAQEAARNLVQNIIAVGIELDATGTKGDLDGHLAAKLLRLSRFATILADVDGSVFLGAFLDSLLTLEPILEIHRICAALPWMGETELSELAADIQQNGLLESIVIYEGKILDGKNRYQACIMAGVQPSFKSYEGTDPIAFVKEKNLSRSLFLAPLEAQAKAEVNAVLVAGSLLDRDLMTRFKLNSSQLAELQSRRRLPKCFRLNGQTRYSLEDVVEYETREAEFLNNFRNDIYGVRWQEYA